MNPHHFVGTEPHIHCGDCLDTMSDMPANTIDLIYLDPPFNTGKVWIGANGMQFADIFQMSNEFWENTIAKYCDDEHGVCRVIDTAGANANRSTVNYLIFLAVRLAEMRRVLKPSGSIYLHCDNTAGAYIKLLMDAIFGFDNWRNTIAWCYTGPSCARNHFPRKYDSILFYTNGGEWHFDHAAMRVPYKNPKQGLAKVMEGKRKVDDELIAEYRKRGKLVEDWWDDINIAPRIADERAGYPTQKPLRLLERIVRASSREADIVYDPFCGSATTAIACIKHNRQFIGSDASADAVILAAERIAKFKRQGRLL